MAIKKGRVMVVSTLEDAVELINHNSMVLERSIRKLTKKNRNLKILTITAITCAVCAAVKCCKQEEELYKLSIRVNKLANKEGE